MPIMATNKGGASFTPAPVGTHAAICCDVVDNGVLEVTYSGKTTKQHKVTIVWQIDEDQADGTPFRVQKRYTCSLHEKATLAKDLEAWRGREFTDDEKAGFDLETLIAVPALLNVIHAPGRDGTAVWANIASLMRLPKQMAAPKIRDYVRVCNREPTLAQPTGGHDEEYQPQDSDIPF